MLLLTLLWESSDNSGNRLLTVRMSRCSIGGFFISLTRHHPISWRLSVRELSGKRCIPSEMTVVGWCFGLAELNTVLVWLLKALRSRTECRTTNTIQSQSRRTGQSQLSPAGRGRTVRDLKTLHLCLWVSCDIQAGFWDLQLLSVEPAAPAAPREVWGGVASLYLFHHLEDFTSLSFQPAFSLICFRILQTQTVDLLRSTSLSFLQKLDAVSVSWVQWHNFSFIHLHRLNIYKQLPFIWRLLSSSPNEVMKECWKLLSHISSQLHWLWHLQCCMFATTSFTDKV